MNNTAVTPIKEAQPLRLIYIQVTVGGQLDKMSALRCRGATINNYLCHYPPYTKSYSNEWGFFYAYNLAMDCIMCDLSNDEVFKRWQKCNKDNLPQGADYWYEFMTKRAKRGGKDADKAQAIVDRMDKAK